MADSLIGALGIVLLVLLMFVVLAPLAAAVGAGTAWIVSGFFPSVTDRLCVMLGLDHAYQVGALLAFVGAFFKATIQGVSK